MRTSSNWTVILRHVEIRFGFWTYRWLSRAPSSGVEWHWHSNALTFKKYVIKYQLPAGLLVQIAAAASLGMRGQKRERNFTSKVDAGIFWCGKVRGSTFFWLLLFSTEELFVSVSPGGRLCASSCWSDSSQVSPALCCPTSDGDKQVQVINDLVLSL